MTVFSESGAEDQGTWFPYFSSRFDAKSGEIVYDEPLPGAAKFRIRKGASFFIERQAARKHRSEFVLNTHSKAMERVSFPVDQTPEEIRQERDDFRDYIITGIDGATWSDGRPIECTRENKLKLFLNEEFDIFVGRCLKLLSGLAESSEKN